MLVVFANDNLSFETPIPSLIKAYFVSKMTKNLKLKFL